MAQNKPLDKGVNKTNKASEKQESFNQPNKFADKQGKEGYEKGNKPTEKQGAQKPGKHEHK